MDNNARNIRVVWNAMPASWECHLWMRHLAKDFKRQQKERGGLPTILITLSSLVTFNHQGNETFERNRSEEHVWTLRQVIDASKRRSPLRHQGRWNVTCIED